MDLTVQELEAAINYWRELRPARGNEYALAPEVNILAPIYALMIFRRALTVDAATLSADAQHLLQSWRAASSS
ncbi:MAG: DUF3717 domain-containing protein [Massilia sp.]